MLPIAFVEYWITMKNCWRRQHETQIFSRYYIYIYITFEWARLSYRFVIFFCSMQMWMMYTWGPFDFSKQSVEDSGRQSFWEINFKFIKLQIWKLFVQFGILGILIKITSSLSQTSAHVRKFHIFIVQQIHLTYLQSYQNMTDQIYIHQVLSYIVIIITSIRIRSIDKWKQHKPISPQAS